MKNNKVKKIRREDVASCAGVSKAVVTWVTNGTAKEHRIPESTIRKVKKIARDLGYQPNIWGKLLNTQKSNLIAFLSSRLTDPVTGELIKSTGIAARQKGYDLMLFDLEEVGNIKKRMAEFKNCFADAFIFHIPPGKILELCDNGTFMDKPYCVLGKNMKKEGLPSVEVDNFHGAELAIRHLAGLVKNSLGIIVDIQTFRYTEERLSGLKEILKKFPHIKVEYYYRKSGVNQYQAGASAINIWHQKGMLPDTIFAMGDVMALGALSVLNQKGLNCPKQIKIMGFDGTLLSEYASPPLTTVMQPFEAMGKHAVSICFNLLNGRRLKNFHILLKPKLIQRKSTR